MHVIDALCVCQIIIYNILKTGLCLKSKYSPTKTDLLKQVKHRVSMLKAHGCIVRILQEGESHLRCQLRGRKRFNAIFWIIFQCTLREDALSINT